MTHRERVTIAVAYFNLSEKRKAFTELVDKYLATKTDKQLEEVKELLLKNYTTEQMIEAAEKFGETPIY